MRARAAGFTLVEILVALAIVAVALTAGMRALARSADGAGTLKARTLALWVAQNRLAEAELARDLPPSGRRTGDAAQAGIAFVWRENVGETPNPAFHRIDIEVAEGSSPDYVLARLTGYVAGANRP
ncbi:MAG: type II secretion system minor pseudopilin GspI [Betaproteobacteria bacterium]